MADGASCAGFNFSSSKSDISDRFFLLNLLMSLVQSSDFPKAIKITNSGFFSLI